MSAATALRRGVGYFAVWMMLIGVAPLDLAAGVLAAAAATRVSLRLLPPQPGGLRLSTLPGLALRFAWMSVRAGFDVALRALDPRLPLNPGFVSYPVRLPPGTARHAFAALTSLLPGTVPVEDPGAVLVYHCLDVSQPVAEQLAVEEAALERARRGGGA